MDNNYDREDYETGIKKPDFKRSLSKKWFWGLIPLIIIAFSLFFPLFTDDADRNFLYKAVIVNLDLALISLFIAVIFVIKLIKKKKSIFVKSVVACALLVFAFYMFVDVKNAYDDLVAEDIFITAEIEFAARVGDGSRMNIKFVADEKIYDYNRSEDQIVKGQTYTFKYYKNTNLLYMVNTEKAD